MIEIEVAPEESKEELWRMFLEYAQELSDYDGEKRPSSLRHYPIFDHYWSAPRTTIFIIRIDHEPAGFCIITDTGISYRIDEFYMRPLHRRRGFSQLAVEHVKGYLRSCGKHKILAANVYTNNIPALEFWKRAGFKDTGRRTRLKNLRLIEHETEL